MQWKYVSLPPNLSGRTPLRHPAAKLHYSTSKVNIQKDPSDTIPAPEWQNAFPPLHAGIDPTTANKVTQRVYESYADNHRLDAVEQQLLARPVKQPKNIYINITGRFPFFNYSFPLAPHFPPFFPVV